MAFNPRALCIAVMAIAGLCAMGGSSAAADGNSPAVFTASVGATETARGDGEQITPAIFTINGLSVTCSTVTGTGEALELGPEFSKIRAVPTFSGCHIVVFGITKLVTVTTNGCSYVSEAQTTESGAFTANVTVECPKLKSIEVHVYNSATSETQTLCTYDVIPQGPLVPEGTLTNHEGAPNDIVVNASVQTTVRNTIRSSICGQNETETSVTKGEGTIRGTNESGQFVNVAVSG